VRKPDRDTEEAVQQKPWPVCTRCGARARRRLTVDEALANGWHSILPEQISCPRCVKKYKLAPAGLEQPT